MITDWLLQAPLLGLAAAVLFIPGLLLGGAIGFRGLALWAIAPGFSVGLLAILALCFPFVGIPWGLGSVVIAVLVTAALMFIAAQFVRPSKWRAMPRSGKRAQSMLLGIGLLVGGGLNAARLMTYIGLPGAISQTNDAVFHLNALRWIAMTGSASSLDLPGLVGADSVYPAAWHALASLVALNNDLIPSAANMVSLVIAAAVWPVGIALLARVATGSQSTIPAIAAALSAGLLSFPQLMFEWGVLYPFALSLSLVPATAAVTIMALAAWNAARGLDRMPASLSALVAAVAGVLAIALAQPSSLLLCGMIVLLWGTNTALRRRQVWQRSSGRISIILTICAAWLALFLFWLVLAYLAGPVLWRSYRGVLGAFTDVVMNAHSLLPAAIGMSLLLLIGLVVAVRSPRLRWLAIGWIVVSMLYVVSAGTDIRVVKRIMTGPWYGDSFRLASSTAVFIVLLAAVGLAALIGWCARALARGPGGRRRWTLGAIAVVAIVGVAGIIAAPVVLLQVAGDTDAQSRYTINRNSYLSADEYALLRRLPELVPADALLIANPSTGAAFAFVLGERDIIPRTWSPPDSEAWGLLAAELREVAVTDGVCEALRAYGSPEYVLDFGRGEVGPGQWIMPGMTEFDGQDGFEEVAREGEASLWRITACR